MIRTENRINEEYWDEIIKEIIGEKKEPIFTNEIWEKIKDEHGSPEKKETIEIKLFNLQREGYVKSVLKRKKQAWMFPSGAELLSIFETKTIDVAIAKQFEKLHRVPSPEEILAELKKDPRTTSEPRRITERLGKISKLLKAINTAMKEFSEADRNTTGTEKMMMPPDEMIIEKIGESIEDFDISIIELLIQTQKKNYGT
jgi:hypothetical protein